MFFSRADLRSGIESGWMMGMFGVLSGGVSSVMFCGGGVSSVVLWGDWNSAMKSLSSPLFSFYLVQYFLT
jgi:hypothetical protein